MILDFGLQVRFWLDLDIPKGAPEGPLYRRNLTTKFEDRSSVKHIRLAIETNGDDGLFYLIDIG